MPRSRARSQCSTSSPRDSTICAIVTACVTRPLRSPSADRRGPGAPWRLPARARRA
jgi:hypothetical protein